jgi:hypothetical protein
MFLGAMSGFALTQDSGDGMIISDPKWPGGYVQVLRDQGIEEGDIPHFVTVHGFTGLRC